MRLTLLIPELIWPEPADAQTLDGLCLPALGTLLARADERRDEASDNSSDALIAHAFRLSEDVPYAPLRLLGEGGTPGDAHWACADPVHLRLHQERLILADGRTLGVADEEAREIIASLNAHFADAGTFHAAAADRWYLRLAQPTEFSAPSLSTMAGRRVERQLPEDAGTAWLRKLLNEAQMLLHMHPVNARREESGRMAINSLWLWGPGCVPGNLPASYGRVRTNHPFARGLALACGADCGSAPASLAALLAEPGARQAATGPSADAPSGDVLVVLDDLLRAVQYEDPDAWRDGIQRLETDWFAPLAAEIRRGRLTLDLHSSTIYGLLSWHIGRRDLWRFWRRAATVGGIARRLSGTPK